MNTYKNHRGVPPLELTPSVCALSSAAIPESATHCKDLTNSSASNCAFRANVCALLQSPVAPAARASAMKPGIFDTISVCAAFRLFPCATASPFSAAARPAEVSCCPVDDSSALSCGAATCDCGLLGSTIAGGGAAVRVRGGRTFAAGGKLTPGAGSSSRSSGASSSASSLSVAETSGMRGCTTEAVGHGSVARLCSAHPPPASATNSTPATAAERKD